MQTVYIRFAIYANLYRFSHYLLWYFNCIRNNLASSHLICDSKIGFMRNKIKICLFSLENYSILLFSLYVFFISILSLNKYLITSHSTFILVGVNQWNTYYMASGIRKIEQDEGETRWWGAVYIALKVRAFLIRDLSRDLKNWLCGAIK